MYQDIELREIFHYFFLETLLRISDLKNFVLKGGVNLRLFFNSPRYSEDMDIDVLGGSLATLEKNVYKILNDINFKRKLKTYGIDDLLVNDPSKAKQTQTTQRFKLSLVNNNGDALPTKIEFSRRASKHEFVRVAERVDPEISRKYSSLSYLVNHYDGSSALLQKIYALAGRNQVEARDVFDIFILYLGGFAEGTKVSMIDSETVLKAEEALLSISYNEYQAKVVEFLAEEIKDKYSNKEAWTEIQNRVLGVLVDEFRISK